METIPEGETSRNRRTLRIFGAAGRRDGARGDPRGRASDRRGGAGWPGRPSAPGRPDEPCAALDHEGGAGPSHRASSSLGWSRQSAVATATSFGVTSSPRDDSTSPVVRSTACTLFVAGSVT